MTICQKTWKEQCMSGMLLTGCLAVQSQILDCPLNIKQMSGDLY